MRTRGWQGDLPRGESEARARVLAAAQACVSRFGASKTTLPDVAAELGVTRQTVYRYFPSVADMLAAVGEVGASEFIDRMEVELAGISDPGDAVVAGILFALDTIPADPYVGLLLQAGESDFFSRGASSSKAMTFTVAMLHRMSVDWASHGFAEADLDVIAELVLRTFLSLLQYPFDRARDADEVTRFVAEWITPAITGLARRPDELTARS